MDKGIKTDLLHYLKESMTIKKGLIALFILFLLLIALSPTILSIPFISQHIIQRINKTIPGKIFASDITFSWITGITIKELKLQDSEQRVVAYAEQLVSSKPLLSWFYTPSVLGKIVLTKPVITLIEEAEGGTYSIQHLFSHKTQSDSPSFIANGLTLDIQEAFITFSNQRSELHATGIISIHDDKLVLSKPLAAKVTLPEDSDTRAHGTIQLHVDDKDFCIPLNPFSLRNMKISAATIDPGIITMQNGGLLGSLMSLLRLTIRSNSQVPMWFTPIYVDIKDGIITCQRTDILVSNAFPIALWGKIDLINDSVDMRLGLSAQTLRRAFALVIVSSDFLLQIPISGPVGSPSIDTAGATSRIAGLRLQQTPFPPTILFGTFLRATTAFADRNELPPPPPTTTPFPWS